ncbi:hypothetical protein A3K73_02010 [Candidatus Pacearchaeota archaeon RBG_13_36_9]|nr:MAG: hypothetical protein A3K73_02010 [Candidatus Pacearchaeota archaeon RBG_13_36_9]
MIKSKRGLLVLALIVGLLFIGSVSGAYDFSGDSNAVALWRLEEGALTEDSKGENDFVNNGATADATNYKEGASSVATVRQQARNMRLDLYPSSDFPLAPGSSDKTFSLTFWLRPGLANTEQDIFVINFMNFMDYNLRIYLTPSNLLTVATSPTGGAPYTSVQHASALKANQWYHVGITYDHSTYETKIRIWDDTARVILGSDASGTANDIYLDNARVLFDLSNVLISSAFNGNLDEVAVFNDVLTADEIDAIKAGAYNYPTCTDADRIMRLYSKSNSHGALWNDNTYTYDICCEDIFGRGASECSTATPHPSSCTNPVLWLYQNNNSHASTTNANGYNIPVCYGDLVCRAVPDPAVCDAEEEVVVRLYQDTNSHISNASTTNYPIKICCKDTTVSPSTKVYFADMTGQLIDKADIGDTVLMIYKGKAGSSFDFVIYEEDTFPNPNDKIRTVPNSSTFTYIPNNLAAEWFITREDFEKGGNEDLETFYFEVDRLKSNKLNVSIDNYDDPNDPDVINELPVVKIDIPAYTLPKANRSFKVNEELWFFGYAYDVDNPLNITWELGDGKIKSCISPRDDSWCDPQFARVTYTATGTKPVYLKAEELNRAIGRTVSDYTEVYIHSEGINIFPVISSPTYGRVFNFIDQPIRFNGSESYISKCGLTCPLDIPVGINCYIVSGQFGGGILYCFDYPKFGASGIGTNAGKYDLWFNWTFSDGDSAYGNWVDNYINAADFQKYFFKPQRYKVNLTLGYQPFSAAATWKGLASTEFDIADTVPVCDMENYVWKKWENGVLREWDAFSWCYESNGVPNICCPSGYECGRNLDINNPNYMKCYQSTSVKEICEDYTEQTECNSAPPEVSARSIAKIGDSNYPSGICADDYIEINSTAPCVRYADCLCKWSTTDNTCSAAVEYSGWYCHYPGDDPDEPTDENGICLLKKSSIEGDCQEDSFIKIKWEREWITDPADPTPAPTECTGSFFRTIPCPARLMFFTTISFIAAAGVIITIYVLRHKKR